MIWAFQRWRLQTVWGLSLIHIYKADQLNSLEAQKEFFSEYTKRTGDTLVRLYADEGISGTKIKNRKEFLRMMTDAEHGLFDMVVVKDISRFARNTVDLLQNVRKLRSLGIETQFLTANMTSMGNSEFVLTIFGALAQEESANTSKRVKFGKKMNAEKGRVPNIVYGSDKTIGDYFNLAINKEESKVVQQIYKWYTEEGYGAAKIANMLNEKGYKTKRNCKWSQNATCRILTNEIYTGKIINGKQEVSDFLTGQRRDKDETEWMVVERPELRIIEDETFEKAQEILRGRHDAFNLSHERQSNKHLFSTLIKCKECGWSFRRTVRTYKTTYVRWVCSGRNGRGVDSCPNKTVVDEEELIEVLQEYFTNVLKLSLIHIYAEEAKYYKEKEHQERVVRNKKICFEEKEMEDFIFQNVDRDSGAIRIAKEYVANWQKMKQNYMGYLFWGPVGTGKSYLAACIANALLEQEVTVKMTNFNTILNDLFAAEDKTGYIKALNRYELLIIDDLGVERSSEYALSLIHILSVPVTHARRY